MIAMRPVQGLPYPGLGDMIDLVLFSPNGLTILRKSLYNGEERSGIKSLILVSWGEDLYVCCVESMTAMVFCTWRVLPKK